MSMPVGKPGFTWNYWLSSFRSSRQAQAIPIATMKIQMACLLIGLMILVGCGPADGAGANGNSAGAARGGATAVKLTQFDRARYCDLAVSADGALHAVFTDTPDHFKPRYAYHRVSTDGGTTWSPANNLSDDESGEESGWLRVIFDGKGRLYVIWKYVEKDVSLDGPGGYAKGRLVYRVLEGGNWSKRIPLGDDGVPAFSWFASVAPDGRLHIVWSQATKDTPPSYRLSWDYANLVRQAVLDGTGVQQMKDILVPKPLLNDDGIKALRAAGKPVDYDETRPKKMGLMNMRGYVTSEGEARFIAEHPGLPLDQFGSTPGKQIVLWNGSALAALHTYPKAETYLTFENPPALLLDGSGKAHILRSPEKSEKPVVRDYALEEKVLGDFTNIIQPKTGPGMIANWQAHRLSDGRLAVTAAMSEKGGAQPDDLELYLSYLDGTGKWSEPERLTDNSSSQSTFNKETVGGNAIGAVTSHKPRFAAVALDKAGKPCVLMVNSENTLLGVTSTGVTSGGRVVTGTGTARVDNPAVFFVRLQ
jgi:hypothetical protein